MQGPNNCNYGSLTLAFVKLSTPTYHPIILSIVTWLKWSRSVSSIYDAPGTEGLIKREFIPSKHTLDTKHTLTISSSSRIIFIVIIKQSPAVFSNRIHCAYLLYPYNTVFLVRGSRVTISASFHTTLTSDKALHTCFELWQLEHTYHAILTAWFVSWRNWKRVDLAQRQYNILIY